MPKLLDSIANVAVVAFVLVALGRPDGPVVTTVSEWRRESTMRKDLGQRWDAIAKASLLGARDTNIKVVEFADYECTACRRLHSILTRLIENGTISGIAFRHLPSATSPRADGAARASICANRQGRFREMHERLFTTTEWMQDQDWTREAKAAGVAEIDSFVSCLNDGRTTAELKANLDIASAIGVRGIPAFVSRNGLATSLKSEADFVDFATR